jgi:hypothetical protein
MPRKPAASHTGTPRCISQVAAVWRRVWGVTLPPSPASRTALLKTFLTEATGVPLNSTKHSAINFSRAQRPMCASSRGGTGAGVSRFLVERLRSAYGKKCRAPDRQKTAQVSDMARRWRSRSPVFPCKFQEDEPRDVAQGRSVVKTGLPFPLPEWTVCFSRYRQQAQPLHRASASDRVAKQFAELFCRSRCRASNWNSVLD